MLSFEEIEGCFPDGAVSLPDAWTGVTAQWLHDFAHAVAVAERGACANIARKFVWYEAEGCSPDESNERIAQLIEKRSNS